MGTYNYTFKSVVFESVEVKSVKSVRIKNFLRRLRMVQKIIADFWRTFGGLSKILKNDVIGYGHLQLHFQKCSFRKCKSQKCKNKKNSQKTKKSFVRSFPFESVFFKGTHFLKV